MLYTFSQPNYGLNELTQYMQNMQANDALLLWQDGVLLAVKYPELLQQSQATCYALLADVQARHLQQPFSAMPNLQLISFEQLVDLTEQYFPQLAL